MKIKGKLIIFQSKEFTESPAFGVPKAHITGKSYKGILFTTASKDGYIEFVGESSNDIYVKAENYLSEFIDDKLKDAVEGTIEVEDIEHKCYGDKKQESW